jgi:hypothetical protein
MYGKAWLIDVCLGITLLQLVLALSFRKSSLQISIKVIARLNRISSHYVTADILFCPYRGDKSNFLALGEP